MFFVVKIVQRSWKFKFLQIFTIYYNNLQYLSNLDFRVPRQISVSIFNVSRKSTAVPRYITSDSQHCIQHKMAAFNSMIDRLLKFPMNITNQREELKIINNIARINGYDDKFVKRIYQRQKLKAKLRALMTLVPSAQNETKQRAAITFFPGIRNKLQGIFKRHNIDFVYSNIGVNYLTYLETPRINVTHWSNQVSTKLHVKVVKRKTSARRKDVPSQYLMGMSGI
jgi:uncharacterized protein (UPF0335 family)